MQARKDSSSKTPTPKVTLSDYGFLWRMSLSSFVAIQASETQLQVNKVAQA
jgi:hypothetical protein